MIGCGRSYDNGTTPPPNFSWDVFKDDRIERVGWPANVKEDIWLIEGPGTLRLKIRDGVEREVAFRYARVERDGGRLKTIRLELDKGKLDAVYADAMKLASEWRVTDTKELREFKDTFADRMLPTTTRPSSVDWYYSARGGNELVQRRLIEVHRKFEPLSGKPYFAVFTLDFGLNAAIAK